jgi:hypothetical protein
MESFKTKPPRELSNSAGAVVSAAGQDAVGKAATGKPAARNIEVSRRNCNLGLSLPAKPPPARNAGADNGLSAYLRDIRRAGR